MRVEVLIGNKKSDVAVLTNEGGLKTIKSATTKTYHYETIEELKKHLMSYLLYYNHQKKLKALKFKSPYDILLQKFDSNPELFKENPYLKLRGLNIYITSSVSVQFFL